MKQLIEYVVFYFQGRPALGRSHTLFQYLVEKLHIKGMGCPNDVFDITTTLFGSIKLV